MGENEVQLSPFVTTDWKARHAVMSAIDRWGFYPSAFGISSSWKPRCCMA
jgi:hypothetical protein